MELARPSFLWAGVALAGLPLLLHLLRPVERARKLLPTSRFLTPDPRRRVRLHRTPDETVLLATRMLLCLLLGMAFAGLSWVGWERGVVRLAVVDGGSSMRGAWGAALDALAREAGSAAIQVAIVRPGNGPVPGLERLSPGLPSAESWGRLAPEDDAEPVRLAHLVRALRTTAEATVGYDSVAGFLVTRPSWTAWAPGTASLLREIWPGRVTLVVPEADEGAEAESASRSIRLHAPAGLRAPAARALTVLDFAVDSVEGTDDDATGVTHVWMGPEPGHWNGLWLPTAPTAADPSPDAFLFLDGRTLAGAGPWTGGTPAPGTTVSLLRAGGRPAAAATASEDVCHLVLPLTTEAPVVASGDLVTVLDAALREGCGHETDPPGAEAAFRTLFNAPAGAAGTLSLDDVRSAGAGRPLTRWLLALALLVAALEMWMARRIEAKRRGSD